MHRAMRRAGTLLMLAVATGRAQQLSVGQLVVDTVHAKSLERNLYGDSPDRSMLVYLPQSYASSPNRRYPVVYLLHGYGGDERGWAGYAPIKPAMDTLVRAGIVREMIVVMPNGNNALGGSFYTNSTTTGNWWATKPARPGWGPRARLRTGAAPPCSRCAGPPVRP